MVPPLQTARFRWTVIVLLVGGALVLVLLSIYSSRWYALRRMPPDERGRLFQSVRSTVQASCRSTAPAVRAECHDQLDFLLLFPECDASCGALAAKYRPLPGK